MEKMPTDIHDNDQLEDLNAIVDEGSTSSYYTEFPKIIINLNLDVYELATYLILISSSSSFRKSSSIEISKRIGISESKYKEVKKSLSKPREELDGLSLIRIVPRKGERGSCLTNIIEIVNIWPIAFRQKSKLI